MTPRTVQRRAQASDDPWAEQDYATSSPTTTPRLDRYNANRKARNLRPLNLDEYQVRCDWMAIYRDTFDDAERAHYVKLLKRQDEPALALGEFREEQIGMPQYCRDAIAHLAERWSSPTGGRS